LLIGSSSRPPDTLALIVDSPLSCLGERDLRVLAAIARVLLAATVLAATLGVGGNPNAVWAEGAKAARTYVVQAGDTVFSIARRHKISVDALVKANNLSDSSVILAGQKLTIPGSKEGGVTLEAAQVEPSVSLDASKPDLRGVPKLAWPIELKPPRIAVTTPFRTNHRGIDIGAPVGTPIKAMAGGVVTATERNEKAYGLKVVIDHGNGVYTWYAHLSAFAVEEGDEVEAGQTIGAVGSTGQSTGPHLHFELRIENTPVDPRPLL
jgi:lipoprotein YgeR